MTNKIQILGLGNILCSDDGIGVRVVQQLRTAGLANVIFIDGGTLGLQLASWLENTSGLIILDAAQIGCEPGTVKSLIGEAMDAFTAKLMRSPHALGVIDLLHIMQLQGTLPMRRALIVIQYQSLAWGLDLTAPVLNALPTATQQVQDLISKWQNELNANG